MKAILEYTLPEDGEAFNIACVASENYYALQDVLNLKIRNVLKYQENVHEEYRRALEDVRQWIYDEVKFVTE